MGRLGPLTSQALGRSPYDDVVQGEGVDDPRAPPQQYDDRGRPVNPETRRINRDVIRSHNEVMQVIGVAEPENGIPDAQAVATRKQRYYENQTGKRLYFLSGILQAGGVWGVNGMRQRILLYKEYSQVPFHSLFRYHKTQQSIASYLFSGLPCFILSGALQQMPPIEPTWLDKLASYAPRLAGLMPSRATCSMLSEYMTTYVSWHLDIFTFMQRAGLASSTAVLPSWKFFIPGSSVSPIFIPPLPNSFSSQGIINWLGRCVLGVLPVVGYHLYCSTSNWATMTLCALILETIPHPHTPRKRRQRREAAAQQQSRSATTTPSTPASRAANGEGPRNGRDIARSEPTLQVLEGQPPNEALPVGAVRRQSTISVRGDEFASDDEDDAEVVSATLISFDVEATESTDTTPGVWSAELRPNLADVRSTAGQEPQYRDTALFRLPPILAADAIGITIARIALAPYESQMWLGLVAQLFARSGRSLQGFHGFGFLQACSWRRMVNVIGVEMILLLIQGEAWGLITLLAGSSVYSEEEWSEHQDALDEEGEEDEDDN